jgi:hypothetical protein
MKIQKITNKKIVEVFNDFPFETKRNSFYFPTISKNYKSLKVYSKKIKSNEDFTVTQGQFLDGFDDANCFKTNH